MKQLKLLICLFFLILTIPIGYFVFQTYNGLAKEETARLRFFAETILDEIENELVRLVHDEESRLVDEYNFVYQPLGSAHEGREPIPSPLSDTSKKKYILGYFQNNPDGSFHTPLMQKGHPVPDGSTLVVNELRSINSDFNTRRATGSAVTAPPLASKVQKKAPKAEPGFEEPYLDRSRKKTAALPFRQQQNRVEEITEGQALRLSRQNTAKLTGDVSSLKEEKDSKSAPAIENETMLMGADQPADAEVRPSLQDATTARTFQVEIAPLQSMLISNDRAFMFRRVVISGQIYRQGFVIKLKSFADHLAAAHFSAHPIAQYAGLHIDAGTQNGILNITRSGVDVVDPVFSLQRTFSFPFDYLSANLDCSMIPHSANRQTLDIMMMVFVAIFALGFLAIYQSARTVIDLSERRSRFVASVTHELKTPLTNIRMYIELLEQGIAGTPEREQEYFSVLNTESTRLSRLINNVLELSRLENRQRHIDLQEGDLREVFKELETVLGEKIRQEGFALFMDQQAVRPFRYDAESLMLILINLIENSLKFGRQQPLKSITVKAWQEGTSTYIAVTDTGPGIPRQALKKIFREFYRVKGPLTQTTGGTGIGLALVRKLTHLMNGTVRANNNEGPGCTITLSLPFNHEITKSRKSKSTKKIIFSCFLDFVFS